MPYPLTPVEIRFSRKFEPDLNSGCWIWSDALDVYGYGRLQVGGKVRKAHHVSYELEFGEIPEGKIICHKCDVRCCVNPSHLYAGTWSENVADMMRRNRFKCGGKPHKGEKNGRAILSEKDVTELLHRKSKGEKIDTRAEANKHGVAIYAIQNVLGGRSWKHIPRTIK